MVKPEYIMLGLGVGGIAIAGYAIVKGISIQEEIGKAVKGFGMPQFLPFEIPSLEVIQVPQIAQLTERLREVITLPQIPDFGEIISDAIPEVPSISDILPKFDLPDIPSGISSAISSVITSVPRGISQGITETIQQFPITTGAVTGATIGATIGSIVPGAGTLAGAVVGGTTGLVATKISQVIPDIQNWFKGLGEYRGLGTQAIGKVAEVRTALEPTSVIQKIATGITPTQVGLKTVTVLGEKMKMPTWWKPTGTEIMTAVGGMTMRGGWY